MIRLVLVGIVIVGISACNTDGSTVFSDENSGVVFGRAVDDTAVLSIQVRQALRRNGQTAQARINVSQQGDDIVRLAGFVDNDAIKYEAERVAANVNGVRHVVNDLDVRP